MAKRDYYEVLGVSRQADSATLKRAYRSLAMKHHPDRNRGDKQAEQTFKEIGEAYEVLSSDNKRAAYDRFGHNAFSGGNSASAGSRGQAEGFGDVFENMFSEFADMMGGGRTQRASSPRGADLRAELELSLEEAFQGVERALEISAPVACEACHGKGSHSGGGVSACTRCGGRGAVRVQQGFFTLEQPCRRCAGLGRVIADPCRRCNGSGQMRGRTQVAVKIPRGAEEGTRIRVLEKGGFAGAMGGKPGDLYIFLKMKEHPLFLRKGETIFCRLPISMTSAALGRAVELPSIDGGRVSLKIPAGSQPEDKFRLRGKGSYALHKATRGDMIVVLDVEIPRNLTPSQRASLEKFETEEKKAQTPESSGFLSRVKEFWKSSKKS